MLNQIIYLKNNNNNNKKTKLFSEFQRYNT